MLGIFDSGLGGLTVVRRVRALLPDVDIVFLADRAHVPYGDRSTDELSRLLAHNVAYLERAGAEAIVMGCNTTCAVAAERGWPRAAVPIFDLIAAAADAVAVSGAARVGVIATAATTRTGAYGDAVRARTPRTVVQEVAAPQLVPLVEAGTIAGPVARAAVAEALAPFALPIDALVLACTHYPLLEAHFAAVLGARVRLIDPAIAQAEHAAAWVRDRGATGERGSTCYITTGSLAPFRSAVAAIVGELAATDEIVAAPLPVGQ